MPSTPRRRDRPHRLPSFAAIAGVAGVLAASLTRDNLQAHLAPARVGEQPPSSTPTSLPVRTSSDSAAFARASTTALTGEGRAAGITRGYVDGVELHMHPNVGVCSIEYDELIAVLLLRQQRGHAVQPTPGLWNGRRGAVSLEATRLLLGPEDREVGRVVDDAPRVRSWLPRSRLPNPRTDGAVCRTLVRPLVHVQCDNAKTGEPRSRNPWERISALAHRGLCLVLRDSKSGRGGPVPSWPPPARSSASNRQSSRSPASAWSAREGSANTSRVPHEKIYQTLFNRRRGR
jgi:hypothetical protein